MSSRARRRTTALRATLAVAVVAPMTLLLLPAGAATAPLKCAGATSGFWQGLDPGVTVTHVAVNPGTSTQAIASDATTLRRTTDSGCTWTTVFTAPAGASIVGLSWFRGSVMNVLVKDGAGAAVRPRDFYASSTSDPSFAEATDLPAAGTPVAISGSRRRTSGFLALVPASPVSVPGTGAPLPGLPVNGLPSTGPVASGDLGAAVLESTDGGQSFSAGVSGSDLPGNVTELLADDQGASVVWIVAGGKLMVSKDGAKSFSALSGIPEGATALAPVGTGEIVAFVGSQAFHITNLGAAADQLPAPAGVTSAAVRGGDTGHVLLAAGGKLVLWSLKDGTSSDITPGGLGGTPTEVSATTGGTSSTFLAAAAQSVLRYTDPVVVKTDKQTRGTVDVGDKANFGEAALSPGSLQVKLGSGERRTVPLKLTLPEAPTPVDLLFLLDHSTSFGNELDQIKHDLGGLVNDLLAQGVDLRVGLVVAGSRQDNGDDDPPLGPAQGANSSYEQPLIYRRVVDMSDPEDFLNSDALASVQTETIALAARDPSRRQDQYAALHTALDGDAIPDPNTAGATNLVEGGQQINFRPGVVRRVIVDITDADFVYPDGNEPAGTPKDVGAVERLAQEMKSRGVLHLSIIPASYGDETSKPEDIVAQHSTLAKGTGTLVGPGGLDCGNDQSLKPGEPAVCLSTENISATVGSALKAVKDLQPVAVAKTEADSVLTALAFKAGDVDAFQAHTLPVSVTLSCPVARAATTHTEVVQASFRGNPVAQSQLSVVCAAGPAPPPAAVVVPPKAAAPVARAANAPAAPVAPVPAPAPPIAPPVVVQAPAPAQAPQVQPQPAPQGQVNAQYGVATEEQQQAALALAAANAGGDVGLPSEEHAFVDRRSQQSHDALVVLALGALMGTGALIIHRRKSTSLPPLAVNQEHQ